MAARRTSTSRVIPLAPAPATAAAPALPAVLLGWIVDGEPGRELRVDYPGNPRGPTPARLLVALTASTLQAAAAARQPVALVFERGDPALPLISGLVQDPAAPVVRVDGERVVLTGEAQVELRCGEASITLDRGGKLVIRGAYVETRAQGTNRIKGGSVRIN